MDMIIYFLFVVMTVGSAAQEVSNSTKYATIAPISDQEKQEKDDDKLRVTWIVLCAMFTLLVFGFATIQYIRKRAGTPKRRKERKIQANQKKKEKEERGIGHVTLDSVRREYFLETFSSKLKNKKLYYEYLWLCRKHESHPHDTAMLPQNREFNLDSRLCVPYDYNRVSLKKSSGYENTYYNASFIDGYSAHNHYIAAQGPQMHTLIDFWRLVWQENVNCIAMVTSLYEHARLQCVRYWPKNITRVGPLLIRNLDTDEMATYSIRSFALTHEETGETKNIRQFQITSWSEHDCPTAAVMLEFHRRIRNHRLAYPAGPLLVHDSHGAGRAGTYIVLDLCLDRLTSNGDVAVLQMALHARNSRPNLLRSLEQYKFVYECVSHYLRCGDTSIPVQDLEERVKNLMLKSSDTRMTGFQQEHKALHHVVKSLGVGECAAGHRQENRNKSRNIMIQPPERSRPYLMTFDPNPIATDFINATFVSGYRRQNAYVVTQWPMQQTCGDFWRLVWDHRISAIVILNNVKSGRSYPVFVPVGDEKELVCGPMVIRLRGDARYYPDYYSQDYIVTKKPITFYKNALAELGEAAAKVDYEGLDENSMRLVRVYQVTSWGHQEKLPASSSICDIIDEADRWTHMHGSAPVVVMSKDGCSRVGVFCTVSFACEQMKAEHEVDIFNAAQTIRKNRPQLLKSVEEYKYVYMSAWRTWRQYCSTEKIGFQQIIENDRLRHESVESIMNRVQYIDDLYRWTSVPKQYLAMSASEAKIPVPKQELTTSVHTRTRTCSSPSPVKSNNPALEVGTSLDTRRPSPVSLVMTNPEEEDSSVYGTVLDDIIEVEQENKDYSTEPRTGFLDKIKRSVTGSDKHATPSMTSQLIMSSLQVAKPFAPQKNENRPYYFGSQATSLHVDFDKYGTQHISEYEQFCQFYDEENPPHTAPPPSSGKVLSSKGPRSKSDGSYKNK